MSELKLQQSRLDGRYDIVECLGRGSYAEIYVANDNAAPDGAPRTIVIKALNIYPPGRTRRRTRAHARCQFSKRGRCTRSRSTSKRH